jgi:hypothetical protein
LSSLGMTKISIPAISATSGARLKLICMGDLCGWGSPSVSLK